MLGTSGIAVRLALPQMPCAVVVSSVVFVAAQMDGVPPLTHVQVHWPLPLSTTLVARAPLAHKLADGGDGDNVPLAVPQKSEFVATRLAGAEQVALIAPGLVPAHCQVHVLLMSSTGEGVLPAAHKSTGTEDDATPLAEPHWPLFKTEAVQTVPPPTESVHCQPHRTDPNQL